jgi:hypothetical protein
VEKVEVKVGQVWEDWDSRYRNGDAPRRRIKVLEIKDGRARVQSPSGQGARTWIRLDRFRPTASGYKLVEDVT